MSAHIDPFAAKDSSIEGLKIISANALRMIAEL